VQVTNIPKSSAGNTAFTVTDVNGTKRAVSVPEGIILTLAVPALHYNRKILVNAIENCNSGLTDDYSQVLGRPTHIQA
jgi:hypothetical protein